MAYKLKIEPEVILDIQEAIDYYNFQQTSLGKRFYKAVIQKFTILRSNPFFEVRYNNVRCLPVDNFPYLIHFTVDEPKNFVTIRAVLHTSRNPKVWERRTTNENEL